MDAGFTRSEKFVDHSQFILKRIHPEGDVLCIVTGAGFNRLYCLRLALTGKETIEYQES